MRDNALDAVYRWVVAPDGENSQKCLDVGNECPDTPAGLLSLSSFWAFGNLLPLGEQVVPTPPGLAANGLVQTLLTCALYKGGTRKVKERYEEYFKLGVDVLTGTDNWEESLAAGIPPHRKEDAKSRSQSGTPARPQGEDQSREGVYRHWTPPPRGEDQGGKENGEYRRWNAGPKG
jgi:hypothetical protein